MEAARRECRARSVSLAHTHTTLVLTQFPCYYFRPRRIDLSIERRRDNFDRLKSDAVHGCFARLFFFRVTDLDDESFISLSALTARAFALAVLSLVILLMFTQSAHFAT